PGSELVVRVDRNADSSRVKNESRGAHAGSVYVVLNRVVRKRVAGVVPDDKVIRPVPTDCREILCVCLIADTHSEFGPDGWISGQREGGGGKDFVRDLQMELLPIH